MASMAASGARRPKTWYNTGPLERQEATVQGHVHEYNHNHGRVFHAARIQSHAAIPRPARALFPGSAETLAVHSRDLEAGRVMADEQWPGPQGGVEAEVPTPTQGRHKPRRISTLGSMGRGLWRRPSAPLPPKKGTRFYRYFRWNFGSVYRRIFTLAFVCNIAVLAVFIGRTIAGGSRLTYKEASVAVSANILAAILIRNEHVVNGLFIVFASWPRRLPLAARRLLAKVYSYGGIHSGCGVAALFWYVAFAVLLTVDYQGRNRGQTLPALRGYVYLLTYAILLMLVLILAFAHPAARSAMHNWFEGVHRFMGWSVVLLSWAQTLLIVFDDSPAAGLPYGRALLLSPGVWLLVAISLLLVYPWTRLRRREVQVEQLSKHCVKLNFSHGDGHYGQAIRLTDAPLRETHAFAVIPNPRTTVLDKRHPPRLDGRGGGDDGDDSQDASGGQAGEDEDELEAAKAAARARALAVQRCREQLAELSGSSLSNAGKQGFSVIISDAGDWTRRIIAAPPTHIYTRGVPQYGVLRVAGMFSPVILVATGSGIAPCLSLLAERPDHPVRVLWSAPSPVETFGRGVVDTVLAADADAVIHDTRKLGRPDLVKMAYRMWEAGRTHGQGGPKQPCEAVVVISNVTVTRKVVYGLESRGVPVYGAIFDS